VTGNLEPSGQGGPSGGRVGLVLSGGGARGAYELGVLSVLAPVLERRGESPRVIVGTSAGALNAVFLAAGADRGFVRVVEAGCQLWRDVRYGDVLGPLLSARDLGLGLRFGLEFLGIRVGSTPGLLDSAPLADTIKARVSFGKLAENVRSGVIEAAGVAATSYQSGRSVVFYDGPASPPGDDKRAIDYARTRLAGVHVRASAAIEALFPAVQVTEPAGMGGWYGDGGTSLNTPLKPALALGADRLIVIGLNSIAGSPRTAARRPADLFDGAAQAVQTGDGYRVIPYIFVAPRERFAVGQLASTVYRRYYAGLRGLRRAPDLAVLGRLLDAARNPARGELFSYVFFAPEFAAALIEQGRHDAQRWLAQDHHDGPWRVGNPPATESQPAIALPGRPRPPSRDRDHSCTIHPMAADGRLERPTPTATTLRPRIFLPDRHSLRASMKTHRARSARPAVEQMTALKRARLPAVQSTAIPLSFR
jgi:NTE family protein